MMVTRLAADAMENAFFGSAGRVREDKGIDFSGEGGR
jgi:hypothetical protein